MRGHDESLESINKWNFVELCELFSKFDLTFKVKCENYHNLTSHDDIQNELIEIITNLVLKQLHDKVVKTGYY